MIICTRNRPDDLFTCLDSIAQQRTVPTELIIVDSSDQPLNSDSTFIAKFNPAIFKTTHLIYKHTKPGLPLQRNVGASLASADIFYFFDDDTILESGYLEQMNAIFAQHLNYGGGMGAITNVGSKQMNLDRLIRKTFFLQRDHASGNFTLSGLPTHTYGTTMFKDVQVLGGCCMAYRSWVFKKHLFDEALERYAYMEDCDFSRRVSYDYPLFFNPEAKLRHLGSPVARDKVIDNRAMYIKNYRYLFFKNFYPKNKWKIVAYWWSIVGLFVQALVMWNMDYIKGYWKGLSS